MPCERLSALLLARVRPAPGKDMFPFSEDGFGRDEGEVKMCTGGAFKEGRDNVFFMGKKRDTEAILLKGTGKRLVGDKQYTEDAEEAVFAGNDKDEETNR